ncbi:protein obstructor-E-like [Lutzomyia longipalpis]|uniref:protein obstructor-E-like n=1 Tax=Lutzomyia longipalpis TaxID=7200 RepID=UPI002483A371|nr:protein obstructor-E-like [Lutzomyia longipalpis]
MGRLLSAVSVLLLISASYARVDPNKICQDVPDRSFLSDFTRCERYFVCVNGVAHTGECPEPFFFNEATQACDHQRNVACRNCPSDAITTMANPVSKTCDSYVRCISGEREEIRCPVGFIYDETLGRCNLLMKAECFAATCTDAMDPSTFTFVPSKIDCSRYFICHQGKPTVRHCAAGLRFNPSINGCDLEANVVCTPNGPLPVTVPEEIEIDCPETGMTFLPHPSNCRQAYLCVNGTPQLIACSIGLAWDNEKDACVPQHQTPCV